MLVIENSVCYNRNMSINIEKKSEQILINVTPSTYKLVAKIAETEDRQVGYVARELMTRGIDLYIEDGKLRDVDSTDAVKAAIREGIRRAIPDTSVAASRTKTTQRTQRVGVLKEKAK